MNKLFAWNETPSGTRTPRPAAVEMRLRHGAPVRPRAAPRTRDVRGVDALSSMKPARAPARFGVTRVDVRGFRSAREVAFLPGPVCALVGEANAGKSNLLAAIRAVLDPTMSPLTATDLAEDGDGEISINVRLADGSETKLQGSPERNTLTGGANAPPTLFLPAEERAGADSARKPSGKGRATGIFEQAFARETPSPAGTALAVLEAVEC
jgi:hypothetical protein